VQFEEKHFTWLERAEIGSRRCPEIYLAEVLMPPQHLKPIIISDSDHEVEASVVH